MREIKFRAWNKSAKKMNHVDNPVLKIAEDSGVFLKVKEEHVYMSKYSDLMQYTGLKDCNGNEIYDGDIITMGDGKVPSFVFWDKNDLQFKFRNIPRNEIYEFSRHSFRFVGEIIGNIYENPELGDYVKAERAGRA